MEGNKYTVKVVEDNNSIRKVFVGEEDKLTVVTYNKDTGEFDIKEIGKSAGEKKEYKLESKINDISKQGIKETIDNSIITPLYLILLDEKDLWWGYGLNVIQYTGQNDYVWNLYTPKSAKSVYENSHNANNL
nr:geobacillin-26 family protein [Thermoanaerobacter sp. A7A]